MVNENEGIQEARMSLSVQSTSMLSPPKPFVIEGELKSKWKQWKQRFQLYMTATESDKKSDEIKKAILLHSVGEEILGIFNTLNKENATYEESLKALEDYFMPKANVTVERHNFYMRTQSENEEFNSFYNDIKKLVVNCDFGDMKDDMIRDRIVCGIKDPQVKQRLLREDALTLEKAVNICRASETAQKQLKVIASAEVSQVKRANKDSAWKGAERENNSEKRTENKNTKREFKCKRCGRSHEPRNCPAFNQECIKCKKKGHFAKCCLNKNKKVQVLENETQSEKNENKKFTIGTISKNENKKISWIQKVQVENSEINFKLDSGAEVNVLPVKDFKKISKKTNVKMCTSRTQLQTYDGTSIKVIGKCNLKLRIPSSKRVYDVEFEVVNLSAQPILGQETIEKLNLVKRNINRINERQEDHSDVFNGIGKIESQPYKIKLKENYIPKVAACRPVPFKLKNKVKQELKELEDLGIIEKVYEPTEFVHPMVLVIKPDKSVRIAIDPSSLNEAVMRPHTKMNTFEEIAAEVQDAKIFAVLDANRGFYQICMEEESSKYLTFITPFGRYRWKRLPYGVSFGTDAFCQVFSEIFAGIEGCITYVDEILIWASSEEELQERLRAVFQRARENGVKFNKSKSQIGLKEVTYLGHKLTCDGIKPDENKVEAIKKMPVPEDTKALARFLGLLNYLGKFIPNLAEKTVNLRNLNKKGVAFVWTNVHQDEFDKLKEIVSRDVMLKYYNPDEPITLSVDSSKKGLGAVILQKGRPLAFASKVLTKSQMNYAPIELETLAIVFGCERFRQYLIGHKVNVESDHSPLEAIFKKDLNSCPVRLQRFRIRLQEFDLNVKYIPGKHMYIADTLSRAPVDSDIEVEDADLKAHVNMINYLLNVTPHKQEEIRVETSNDVQLRLVIKCIVNGWPEYKNLPQEIKSFWPYRHELTIIDGIVYRNNEIVMPCSLHKEMLDKLHYNHMGIVKTKLRAQDSIFWPTISKDIENMVSNCDPCLTFQRKSQKEPLINRELPSENWENIAADLFYLDGKDFLLVVDMFSKYPELISLENTTSGNVINKLKNLFARYGIPKILYSDNGPQFASVEFKNFVKKWDFVHKTSSPNFPQSNGFIERHVQTVKKIVKKAIKGEKDIHLSMLEYRNTPISSKLPSPAEIFLGRKLNGLLPFVSRNKDNKESVREQLSEAQNKQKYYHDRKAREQPELSEGDIIRIRNDKNWERAGVVVDKADRPRSYKVKMENGNVLERNRNHLLKGGEYIVIDDDETVVDQSNNHNESENVVKQEQVINENASNEKVVNLENNVNQNSLYCTRSGRQTRPPAYLKDFVK